MDLPLIKVTPNREKAKSFLRMVTTTLEMIKTLDKSKFPSNITKDYYEVLRELMSIIILLDGYKLIGEESHKRLIEYINNKYDQISPQEIIILNKLRITRNKISYDGFFVKEEFLNNNLNHINTIIKKLNKLIDSKLKTHNIY